MVITRVSLNKILYPPNCRFPLITERMKERAILPLAPIILTKDYLLLDGGNRVALAWALGHSEIEAILLD